MWWHRGLEYLNLPTHQRRTTRFIDRDFQVRYGSVVIGAALLGALVSLLPIYFFLDQNYRIFLDLAHLYSPGLMDNLERERIWVTMLLFSGFSGLTIFFLVLSFRLTNRIVGPLRVLRNHLRRMSRGQWFMAPVRVRDSDEFQDLIDSYNYFYESFRTQLRRDLDMLRRLRVDPADRASYEAWRILVEEKSLQLNVKSELPPPFITGAPSGLSAESPDSRRVS